MTQYARWPSLGGGGGGGGTVTSVGLVAPSIFTVTGSPVTTSGNLILSLNNETANLVFAGPASGAAAPPTFRSIVAADITGDNITDVGTDGIVITGGTGAVLTAVSLAQHVADTTHNGYLSSTDWNTFNGKQSTITIGALDAQAENANGLALVSNILSSQSADAIHPGMVNTTTQTLAGNKTFTGQTTISNASTAALTINSTAFIFDSTNNALGIGIQPSTTVSLDIVNSTGAAKPIQATAYGVGSTVGVRGRFARGTSGSPSAIQSGDIINFISGRGYGTSQFATAATGVLNIVAGETFTNTSNLTYIQFMTTPTGSVTSAESMRVTSTGVTIGPQSSSTAIHQISGGVNNTTRTTTTSLTVDTTTTDYIILCNQSGAISITLPTPTVGRTLIIKDISGTANTNNISVLRHASEKIEGLAATKVLQTNFGSFTITSDGTDWWLI